MRRLNIFLFYSASVFNAVAQDSFYNHLEFGKYTINYADTLIYDAEINYQQFGYSGSAPLFAQIWFPSTKSKKGKKLNFGQYKRQTIPKELTQVYEKLTQQIDEIFIRDAIEYDLATDEPINYGTLTTNEILQKIYQSVTKSSRSEIPTNLDYPVIIYHHGSQGNSFENSLMAEYFASHGYVFIASNFHLPYDNTIYGLLPYHLEKENKHNQSSAKAIINFAKTITNQNSVYFIGHSWGAQEGWCFLNDSSYVDAFVSMETTIEFKSDTTRITELWPYVWDAIKVKKNKFSIPILSFAAQDDDTNFDFFKNLNSAEMIFASYKKPFAHNSYTSIYLMRYFLGKNISIPDAEILASQITGYNGHLNLIRAFLESLEKKEKLNFRIF